MQRIGKVDFLPAMAQRGLNLVVILNGNSRQRDQMLEAIHDFIGWLPGDGPQHPLQLKDHRFRNKHVTCG